MRRKRRQSRGWVAIMLLVLLALVAVILFRYVFVVRNVRIQYRMDTEHLPEETVIRAANIDFGGSIFFLDEERMRQGVNALGTIRLEDVEVDYPNALTLYVARRERVAMLLHMGDIRLLDDDCCLVESVENVPDTDLIYVNGMHVTGYSQGQPLQAREGQVEAYCAIMQALRANGANAYVSEIELSDVANLTLITRTGITVELGDMRNMQDKIAWMRSAVADLEQRNEGGGTLDVRSGTKADYRRPGMQSQTAEESAAE